MSVFLQSEYIFRSVVAFALCPINFIPMEEIGCQATIAFKARKTVALGKISPT